MIWKIRAVNIHKQWETPWFECGADFKSIREVTQDEDSISRAGRPARFGSFNQVAVCSHNELTKSAPVEDGSQAS